MAELGIVTGITCGITCGIGRLGSLLNYHDNGILLEDGSYLLLEDGSYFLLEEEDE